MIFNAIHWDPDIGIHLGSFTIRYYSLMYVLGFLVGYYVVRAVFRREKENEELLDPLLIYIALGVILGARLGHVFFYDWPYFSKHPLEILLPFRFKPEFEFTGFQGLASHGATIGIALAAWLFYRKYKTKIRHHDFLWWVDRLTLAIPFGGAMIRIGNLLNSEIVGKPTGSDYGFIFVQLGENFPRHPTQLYEAGSYLLLFFLMLWIYWKTRIPQFRGMMFGIFFTLLWVIRFVIEFWKEPQDAADAQVLLHTGLDKGQWLSVPFILIGLFFIWYGKKHRYNEAH